MEGFRARDADRDRCVEVIEAAYVDGQIGDADRELRISRALSAETLDELGTLTRDLQGSDAVLSPTSGDVVRRRPAGAALAGLGALVVLAGAGVLGLVSYSGTSQPGQPGVEVVEGSVPSPSDAGVAEQVPSFEMTAAEVRRFLRRYEARFGTLDAWDVSFFPDRVSVDVPVRGSRPRYETWTWDGGWERTSEARATSPVHSAVVDLGRIGPDRLVDNIRTAERTLRVQRGVFTHAVLWDDDAVGPTLNIHVGNTFGESGYLRTTLAGDRVVLRLPYDG